MSEFEKQILDFFDRCPTRQQIRSLSLMYAVPEANVIGILERNGRKIPAGKRGPKPKTKGKGFDPIYIDDPLKGEVKEVQHLSVDSKTNKPQVKATMPESKNIITQMPDCVSKTIEKRMYELETDIKNYQEAINNYQDMVHKLEAEYTAHANYLLQCPFEQRNLSHSCSDNKIESPQAMA